MENEKILIVDDTVENITVLDGILRPHYKTMAVKNGQKALVLLKEKKPDLILLDVMMPDMDGYQVLEKIRENPDFRDTPVIFVTAKGETADETLGLEKGAVDYIVKPVVPAIVLARVRTQLELVRSRKELKSQNLILEEKVKERTKELLLSRDVTFQGLAALAETRDNDTGGHILRTSEYVRLISQQLAINSPYGDELSDEKIDEFTKSAPLHDIGKVGIPDAILLKPGKLTDEEFDIMKKHTNYGYTALLQAEGRMGSSSFLKTARDIALYHHEKWDGSGYPEKLSGVDIPLAGRIMALADVYDALISKRVYKSSRSHKDAIDIIKKGIGSHFDPVVAEAFFVVEEKVKETALNFADTPPL